MPEKMKREDGAVKGAPWTQDELRILRGLKERGAVLKKHMHLLPGRTYEGALFKQRHMQLKPLPSSQRVRNLLSDGVERTGREIADALAIPRKTVSDLLRYATDPDGKQWAHVSRITEGYPQLVYAIGPGENARYGDAISAKLADEEESDDVLDARYRSNAAWWPCADRVVVSAMNAMICAGRAAA
ncbi:hypothetical protein [Caballeronia zhejiangensis]|uniref:Uncharacterized protein n=1 Tax=Caballeronia zhejiangensis TaxID=871203 RepID=A0A656Q9Q1_9BURK|nr:hypothetical protein [Caballeronia zhejiangensis]KDR25467.1 hypothetical protein BG60_28360 [Caballeronia zhejiangensis]